MSTVYNIRSTEHQLKSTTDSIQELINETIIPATDRNKVNIERLETSFRNYTEQTDEDIENIILENNKISKMLKIVTIVAGCISLLLGSGVIYLLVQ